MIYSVTFKKFLTSTQQMAVVEDQIEADGVEVTDCGALMLFRHDAATVVTTHVFPPTWWLTVEPAVSEPVRPSLLHRV